MDRASSLRCIGLRTLIVERDALGLSRRSTRVLSEYPAWNAGSPGQILKCLTVQPTRINRAKILKALSQLLDRGLVARGTSPYRQELSVRPGEVYTPVSSRR